MSENDDEPVQADIDDSVEAHGITDTGEVLPADSDRYLKQPDNSVEGHRVNFRPVDNGGTPGDASTCDHRPAAGAGHIQIAGGKHDPTTAPAEPAVVESVPQPGRRAPGPGRSAFPERRSQRGRSPSMTMVARR